MKSLKLFKFLLPAALLCVLTGCGREPLDRKMNLSGTDEQVFERLREETARMERFEREAVIWALDRSRSFDDLRTRRPGFTYRQLVQAEGREFIDKAAPSAKEDLNRRIAENETVRQRASQISASQAELSFKSDVFRRSRAQIQFKVDNGSDVDISSLRWRASLFLDDSSEPIVVEELFDWYEGDGGLRAGASRTSIISPWGIREERVWNTLEVMNAKQRRLVLELLPESVKDFGERPAFKIHPGDLEAELKRIEEEVARVEKFLIITR